MAFPTLHRMPSGPAQHKRRALCVCVLLAFAHVMEQTYPMGLFWLGNAYFASRYGV